MNCSSDVPHTYWRINTTNSRPNTGSSQDRTSDTGRRMDSPEHSPSWLPQGNVRLVLIRRKILYGTNLNAKSPSMWAACARYTRPIAPVPMCSTISWFGKNGKVFPRKCSSGGRCPCTGRGNLFCSGPGIQVFDRSAIEVPLDPADHFFRGNHVHATRQVAHHVPRRVRQARPCSRHRPAAPFATSSIPRCRNTIAHRRCGMNWWCG